MTCRAERSRILQSAIGCTPHGTPVQVQTHTGTAGHNIHHQHPRARPAFLTLHSRSACVAARAPTSLLVPIQSKHSICSEFIRAGVPPGKQSAPSGCVRVSRDDIGNMLEASSCREGQWVMITDRSHRGEHIRMSSDTRLSVWHSSRARVEHDASLLFSARCCAAESLFGVYCALRMPFWPSFMTARAHLLRSAHLSRSPCMRLFDQTGRENMSLCAPACTSFVFSRAVVLEILRTAALLFPSVPSAYT